MVTDTKVCTKCGEAKPASEFYPDRDRLAPACKPCHRQRNKEYRAAHTDQYREYCQQHAEGRNAQAKAWRERNPDQARAYRAAWAAAHPERARAGIQKWIKANPGRYAISRRATAMVQYAIKQGKLKRPSACEECGDTTRRIEAAHGDYSRPLDVRWLCKPCHSRWDHGDPKTVGAEHISYRAIGDRNAKSKLDDDAVRRIRAQYAAGSASGVTLAKEFGVGTNAIYAILRGRTWTHVS